MNKHDRHMRVLAVHLEGRAAKTLLRLALERIAELEAQVAV